MWDEDFRWLSFAFNTATLEVIKTAPDLLFLGRDINSPLVSRWDLSPMNKDSKSPTTQSFWTQAYHNLRPARKNVALTFNKERKAHQFKIGDTVMYKKHLVNSKAQNMSGKLLLRWSESLVNAKIVNSNNVLLTNTSTV